MRWSRYHLDSPIGIRRASCCAAPHVAFKARNVNASQGSSRRVGKTAGYRALVVRGAAGGEWLGNYQSRRAYRESEPAAPREPDIPAGPAGARHLTAFVSRGPQSRGRPQAVIGRGGEVTALVGLLQNAMQNARALTQSGVLLTAGTDAPYPGRHAGRGAAPGARAPGGGRLHATPGHLDRDSKRRALHRRQ
jgi:hypothetical protein